jgi:TRAP-type C4-dicarboxylate transport system permease small subunit
MEKFFEIFLKKNKAVLNGIGGLALTVMMVLTVSDVLLRAVGHPIIGTYEIVALLLALVIGFCFPSVALDRGNVYMEILLERLSKKNRARMNTFTRIIAAALFALIGYNLFSVGHVPSTGKGDPGL